jgi:two-component system response regulator YesN
MEKSHKKKEISHSQIPLSILKLYGMRERILIVDDDASFRQEAREFLEDYEVIDAASGTECLQLLKRANDFDVVVLDVCMPGLSGTDVLWEIRKLDPELGIVIITGHSSQDVAIEALKGRADDYIKKPVDPAVLIGSIEKLLAKKRKDPDISALGIGGKVEKVRRFIEKNKFKKTTLHEAAACVCMSPKYLSHVFKLMTGQSFSDYRLTVKITAAKELLCSTEYNISQISDKLGYENTESFFRRFKSRTGLAPSAFRKKNNKNRANRKA